ncbi:conserved hypothetical protein [Roseovarius sp. EC-HK134]|nr:Hypothetical protein RAK1035_2251 [Roseovarius sp. AK1035]VVT21675.1 conserved hypothetical protein [Roseovarius sp. EC-SD190]VVT21769.1 conserved hypothetical protein [Roseovarius sp. EC-HK134]
MSYLYLSVMSSRLFHSADLDGLHEALTETPHTSTQGVPHAGSHPVLVQSPRQPSAADTPCPACKV